MKRIITVVAAFLLSQHIMAQEDKMQKPDKVSTQYCAVLKDGKITMMQDYKTLAADVTLANGTIIKTDGTVNKADNTQLNLKNGECVDEKGNLINPKGEKHDKDNMIPPK